MQKISSILFLGSTIIIHAVAQTEYTNDSSEPSVLVQGSENEDIESDLLSDSTDAPPDELSDTTLLTSTTLSIPTTKQDKQSVIESSQAINTSVTTGTERESAPTANSSAVPLANDMAATLPSIDVTIPPLEQKKEPESSTTTLPTPIENTPATPLQSGEAVPIESAPSETIKPMLPLSSVAETTKAPQINTVPIVPPPPFVTVIPASAEELAKKLAVADEPLQTKLVGPLTNTSINQALTQLAPLIMSRSVEKAVDKFTNIYPDKALEILDQLIKTSRIDFTKKNTGRPFEIRRNDLLQIIFGVASQYRNSTIYNRFFDLITRYPGLYYGIRPLLFVLSISSYPVLIPDLIEWLNNNTEEEKNIVSVAGFYAVDRTSTRSIKALNTYAKHLLEPLLGPLLFYAISNNKSPKMIATLIDAGANVNYPDISGYTPLIKAVEISNLPLTKLLIEHGADIDLIVKEEIGSAWQKSTELRKSDIMDLFLQNKNLNKQLK